MNDLERLKNLRFTPEQLQAMSQSGPLEREAARIEALMGQTPPRLPPLEVTNRMNHADRRRFYRQERAMLLSGERLASRRFWWGLALLWFVWLVFLWVTVWRGE